MSLKSIIQLIIILIIIIILGGVYFSYFVNNEKISIETTETKIEEGKNNSLPEIEEKKKLSKKSNVNTQVVNTEVVDTKSTNLENEKIDVKEKSTKTKPKIDNLVKEIEYVTTDENGN